MKQHSLKVEPFSEAEAHFMELMRANNLSGVKCKLGALWGKPYNEYIIDDKAFNAIKNYLKTKK